MNLIRLDGWWIGPRNLRVCGRYGANVSGVSAAPFLLELGEFANLTVIGSVAPSGIVPFSFWIARSASTRWSNRINPTPLERPTENNFCIFSANMTLGRYEPNNYRNLYFEYNYLIMTVEIFSLHLISSFNGIDKHL